MQEFVKAWKVKREHIAAKFSGKLEAGEYIVHICLYGALATGQHEIYAHIATPVVVVLIVRLFLI